MTSLELLQPFMPPLPACMLDDEGECGVSSGIVCEGSNAGTTPTGVAASQPVAATTPAPAGATTPAGVAASQPVAGTTPAGPVPATTPAGVAASQPVAASASQAVSNDLPTTRRFTAAPVAAPVACSPAPAPPLSYQDFASAKATADALFARTATATGGTAATARTTASPAVAAQASITQAVAPDGLPASTCASTPASATSQPVVFPSLESCAACSPPVDALAE